MDDLCIAGRGGTQALAAFVGMWAVMMIPMMLPALAPALLRYPNVRGATIAAFGYFAVWAAVGLAAYPIASIALRFPAAAGVAVVTAGLLQFTAWKARRLACCRASQASGNAWVHGLRLGIDCVACCGNLMVALVAVGMMNVAVMVATAVAITAERLAPRLARPIGAIVVGAGLWMAWSA